MNDKNGSSTVKQPSVWRCILLLSSFATIQAKTIIPTLSILSSTIPTSRFPSTLSIFHSSDNIPSNGLNSVVPSRTLPQLCDNEASPELPVDSALPTLDSEVDNESLQTFNIDDIDYIEEPSETVNGNVLEPLLSIVTTTPAKATLMVKDIARIRIPEDFKNDSSIVKMVESQPKQQDYMSTTIATANSIFVYSLAIITGFGEICCLKSYGCFINMVTGSSVRIFMGIAEGQFHTIRLPICVTIGYGAGIIFARILKHHFDSKESLINGIERQQPPLLVPRSTMPNSRLGLKAFLQSITNVPPGKRNPSSELLWSAIPMIFVLFSATEVINAMLKLLLKKSIVQVPLTLHVLLQAVGYGLVAQIMSDVQTIPANVYVLTGHFASVTKSFIDQYLQSSTKTNDDKSLAIGLRSKIQRLFSFVPTAQQKQSIHIVFFFGIGAMISSLMYKFNAALLPFQHSLTGLFYAIAFLWYSLRLSNAPRTS